MRAMKGTVPEKPRLSRFWRLRTLPVHFQRHAQIDDLAGLGFEILKGGNHGRSVKYGARAFVEGHLESLIAEIDDNIPKRPEKADRGAPSPLR